MKITRDNIKSILFIAFCVILMLACLMRFDVVMAFLSFALTVITPVIIGFCIAFVLNIMVSFFEKHLFGFLINSDKKGKKHAKLARIFSIVLTLIVFIGAISLLMFFIIPQIIDTIAVIVSSIPAFTERAISFSKKYLDAFGVTSDQISELMLDGKQILTTVGTFLKNNVNSFVSIGSSVVSSVVSIFLGIFVAMYFLFDKERALGQVKRLFRAILKPTAYEKSAHIG